MEDEDSQEPALAHRANVRLHRRRRRRIKPDSEIVLLCNPRAGGRWRELAGILDCEEARNTRRIVTDSVEDVAAALAELESDTKLICIYGGDGTIQRILDRMTAHELEGVSLALLGGGTMNVTSRWLGMSRKPVSNFRHVIRAYQTGQLLHREIPVLNVSTGGEAYRCFSFGMGPIVRILDAYESGRKGKVAALGIAARAASAALLKWPPAFEKMLEPMKALVKVDGEALPDEDFVAVVANVTGQINPGVEPFSAVRTRDSFHLAAYSVSAREFAAALPMLVRGWLPIDVGELLLKGFGNKETKSKTLGIPADPRYLNVTAKEIVVESESETLYTVDGELLESSGPIKVSVGPTLRLCSGPGATEKLRLVAENAVRRSRGN